MKAELAFGRPIPDKLWESRCFCVVFSPTQSLAAKIVLATTAGSNCHCAVNLRLTNQGPD